MRSCNGDQKACSCYGAAYRAHPLPSHNHNPTACKACCLPLVAQCASHLTPQPCTKYRSICTRLVCIVRHGASPCVPVCTSEIAGASAPTDRDIDKNKASTRHTTVSQPKQYARGAAVPSFLLIWWFRGPPGDSTRALGADRVLRAAYLTWVARDGQSTGRGGTRRRERHRHAHKRRRWACRLWGPHGCRSQGCGVEGRCSHHGRPCGRDDDTPGLCITLSPHVRGRAREAQPCGAARPQRPAPFIPLQQC